MASPAASELWAESAPHRANPPKVCGFRVAAVQQRVGGAGPIESDSALAAVAAGLDVVALRTEVLAATTLEVDALAGGARPR